MKHLFNFTVQHANVDASRHMRLCDLEHYILEAAGTSASRFGLKTDMLVEKYNATWVLTRLTIVADYLPTYDDEIIVETWIEGNAHMFSMRNFRIYLKKGEEKFLIGKCSSVWTLLNLTTRAVDTAAFHDPVWEGIIDGEKLDLPRAKRLGTIEEPTSEMPHTIHYTDLDYNNHCNSIKYLQFMLNADDSLTGIYPIRLDMNYAKEVHKGDAIRVQVQEQPDALQYCILTPSGEISCTALLTKL